MALPHTSGRTVIERPGERVAQTSPDDPPELLAKLIEYLRSTPIPSAATGIFETAARSVRESAPRQIDIQAEGRPWTREQALVAVSEAVNDRQERWLSDVIEEWRDDQYRKNLWVVPETWTNTYGPALRVFRELISREQRQPPGCDRAIWDVRMRELNINAIDTYVRAMWKFPTVQGKRNGNLDAKALLASGLPPQGVPNTQKKFDWLQRVSAPSSAGGSFSELK